MTRLLTLVSAEEAPYQWWQVELLWDSFQRVGQPGDFLALVSQRAHAGLLNRFRCPLLPTKNYSRQVHDDYPPYNKPGSMLEWLSTPEARDRTILVVDPDCLFLKPLARQVESGRPLSQYVFYMEPDEPVARYLRQRYCRRNHHLVKPVGIPTFIRGHDLAMVAPRWFELAHVIRRDPTSIGHTGWIAEMWAFNFAMAEASLDCIVESDFCQFSHEDTEQRPILHYCYPAVDKTKGTLWDKRYYLPWDKPPRPTPSLCRASRRLLEEIDRAAAARDYQVMNWDFSQ